MSAELIGILSVGSALAALELSGRLSMDRRMTGLEARLDESMTGLEARLDRRMTALEARLDRRMTGLEGRMVEMVGRLTAMDRRMARVEGLLIGLGLSGRSDVPPAGN